MSEPAGIMRGPAGGIPAHTLPVPNGVSTSTPAPVQIPAGATAPVWQPWVETTSQVQSALKTEITRATAELNRMLADAQRLLDHAQQLAQAQTTAIEQQSLAAWHRAQDEIARVNESIMVPARAQYERMVEYANDTFRLRLSQTEHAYKVALNTAAHGKNLAG